MKAYIINLKEAIERRNYMQKQLALLPPSLSSEFIEAVNGKGMNREQLEENFDYEKFRLRYAKEVRPGEIGCTLSHQKCYRRLLESKEKYVLILEDDIITVYGTCQGKYTYTGLFRGISSKCSLNSSNGIFLAPSIEHNANSSAVRTSSNVTLFRSRVFNSLQ